MKRKEKTFFFLPPLLLLLLLSFFFPLSLSISLNPDLLGLIVFKSSLSDPTSALSSWSEDSPDPCSFSFVNCHQNSTRVQSLSLSNLSLSGKINRGILQLTYLRKLSLAGNNLTGALNPDISALPSLKYLDLARNFLVGEIPNSFFQQCSGLRVLSIAGNRFSGPIPDNIGSCRSIVSLDLSSNRLSGPLPATISALAGLKRVDLSNNFLHGEIPTSFGELVSLRGMDLSKNLFSGEIPEAMRRLRLLSSMSLGSNSLSGEVPDWIGELALLKRLDLSRNALTGSLPESMSGCLSLQDVDFGGNGLVGGLVDWVFGLGLTKFSVSRNKLSGPIWFPEVYDHSMTVLDLSGNEFSGWIPAEIGNLVSLQFLNLSGNAISGSVPVSLWWSRSVEVVDLSGNLLNGSIPSEIGGCSSLKDLRLERNFLTGKIPGQIGNCSSLTSLVLSQNNLSGPIPPTLAILGNLQIVDLSMNRLTGPLPKNLAGLPRLLSFNISHNLLSGALPSGNFFNNIPLSSLSDNPDLCGSAVHRSCSTVLPKPIVLNPNSSSKNPHPNSVLTTRNLRHSRIISISALIAIGAAALIVLGVIVITILNVHARSSRCPSAVALTISEDSPSHSPTSPAADAGKLVMFSGDDLDFAFGAHGILNKDSELGRGGFGAVYKTVLRDGRPVAIKKLTVSSLVKSQEDFQKEIKKLGKVRHPNLVSLQGFYWTPSLQLLIYEFVTGGNLYKALHESSAADSLSWNERFDIILGTARGLAHLHRHNVIHYNFKSSNVLIDGSGEAKVADYGLARLLPMLDRYVLSSKVQSALGYMAPEFACRTVKITEKCDVYGFGVLVLEVVTGRRPVEYTEDDVVVLCDVVRGAVEGGRADDCVDGKLARRFPEEEAVPVIKLGLICTSQVPSNRPEMPEVVKILEMIRHPQEDLSPA